MRLTQAQIQKLDITNAVKTVLKDGYERLPSIVIDECLSAEPRRVVESVLATFLQGAPVASEVLAMPRRNGFGPRPVTIVSVEARAMLQALVSYLSTSITLAPRLADGWKPAWQAHQRFGEDLDPSTYIVETDIASCYEYVDHGKLVDELILQTSEVAYATAVGQLLGEIMGSATGLPQFLRSADVLADIYLAMMERDLLRAGARVSRFADDFRLIEETWSGARRRIEQAAEFAREYGLVLSSEKTRVYKLATAVDRRANREASLQEYSEAALETLSDEDSTAFYATFDEEESEVDEDEAAELAMRTLLQDWLEESKEGAGTDPEPTLSYYVPSALRMLSELGGDVLDDSVLAEIVFWRPAHLELVGRLLRRRSVHARNLEVLEQIIKADRPTPWGCLWILSLAASTVPSDADHTALEDWANSLLSEPSATVRAQASWYLAERGKLDTMSTVVSYASSSALARPALAAALGRSGLAPEDPLATSVTGDSPRAAVGFRAGSSARKQATGG
ncbi:reverse transcriptase domain-containing protein [Microbacterium oxydans]|uniref:reverse transcriptase domain-containing protein n=1 Tax=Microbacterium oxydans TaxID=82380 RepID=UPI0037CC82A8